jgi:hypothetical protein
MKGVEGESGGRISAKQGVLAVYPKAEAWWPFYDKNLFFIVVPPRNVEIDIQHGKRLSADATEEWAAWESAASRLAASPELKVGESGLGDEQFVKQAWPDVTVYRNKIMQKWLWYRESEMETVSEPFDTEAEAWADARARIEAIEPSVAPQGGADRHD